MLLHVHFEQNQQVFVVLETVDLVGKDDWLRQQDGASSWNVVLEETLFQHAAEIAQHHRVQLIILELHRLHQLGGAEINHEVN